MPAAIANDNQIKATLLCPNCGGSGQDNGGRCAACRGWGRGWWQAGYFFYFDLNLSPALIALRKFKKAAFWLLDAAALVSGVLGLASLLAWFISLPETINDFKELFFWREQNALILFFWLGAAAALFVLYRLLRRQQAKNKINRLAPVADAKTPSAWGEAKNSRHKINVANSLSEEALAILEKIFTLSLEWRHPIITPLHLFYGLLLGSQETASLFVRLNINGDKLFEKLNNQLVKIAGGSGTPQFAGATRQILLDGYLTAYQTPRQQVKAVDLLLGCYEQEPLLAEIFYDLGVDRDKLINVIAWSGINDKLIDNYHRYKKMARFKPSSNMDRAYTAVATPFLNNFSFDLTVAAKFGRLDLCVGREKEVKEVFDYLTSGRRGVVLVGSSGVGKNAIVGGIAQLMVTEEVPKMLKDKRLLELDIARLLGGATPAEAQERMLAALNEVGRAGNIILYIQDLENVTGISVGAGDSLDLAEILTNAVNRQGLYCLATCVSEHYAHDLANKPLGQTMAKVEVNEPEVNLAIQILESKIAWLENKYRVYFTYDALAEAVRLSSRYMHDQYLPEKAVNILEKVAVEVFGKRGERGLVIGDDVAAVVSALTHVPTTKITETEGELLLNLEAKIHERMVGQEEAVKLVAESLRRARVDLREGKRPIASLLFLGPTGVGKTELAKTIAQVYFGDENYMVRLDMSEYQLAASATKMLGAPDGTLGYLTEKVRQSPFSLILLDEIEKAHPDILNLFLQVMDDGRLTDGQGRTVDFTNSIIIATSNVGAVYIQEQVRQNVELARVKQELIDKYLVEKMQPELINRFDGIVVFKPLTVGDVMIIARLMLAKTKQLLSDKGIGLEVSELGLKILAEAGYQPEFGARPLRRLLQDRIDNVIANKILANELARRDTVLIDERGEVQIRQGAAL